MSPLILNSLIVYTLTVTFSWFLEVAGYILSDVFTISLEQFYKTYMELHADLLNFRLKWVCTCVTLIVNDVRQYVVFKASFCHTFYHG